MSNKIDKHYSDFGGLDTRQNKLISDPKTSRRGSKNWRYNFQDEIQQANGWQHKDDNSGSAKRGLIEYKYKDINTGESKTQILGVGDDGQLRKKLSHYIKFTSIGAATSYSFYYDEVSTNFIFSLNGVGQVTVTQVLTMAQLATALNLLAGVVCVVVDDNGTTVIGSTKLAYLGDCVINGSIAVNSIVQSSWYWETVVYGGSAAPFPTTVLYVANPSAYPSYEGISYTNINNSVYITDGGFPMKYDGFSVYRAGMPLVDITASGIATGQFTNGSSFLTLLGRYRYLFQLGFVDANGIEIVSKLVTTDYIERTLTGGNNGIAINLPSIFLTSADNDFPIYYCRVNGNQNLTPAGGTFTVYAGHNIRAGMTMRFEGDNGGAGFAGFSYSYALVTGTTATTITVNFGTPGANPWLIGAAFDLTNTQVVNAGYLEDYFKSKITDIDPDALYNPSIKCGAFIRVYRTKANETQFYKLHDMPIMVNLQYFLEDTLADSRLTISLEENFDNDLPRACKYLSSWQNQLVQAGRPVNTLLKDIEYPTVVSPQPTNIWGTLSTEIRRYYYTEAHLCDFQSIYWSNTDAPEGFPQSGLNEESLDTIFNDQIKGIFPNKDAFFIFKERSFGYLTGTLADGALNKEVVEADFGCVSHRTIQEVNGSLVWLDGVNGFVSCVAGRLPLQIGYPIQDEFKLNPNNLDFSKAYAANFRKENLYVCAIEGYTFVFDYADVNIGQGKRLCWYMWQPFNITSVLATADDELICNSGTRLWKLKVTNTKYDMSNHTTAVPFEVRTAWINFGAPTVDKSYLGCWINSIQGDFSLDVDTYANYLDYVIADESVSFPIESSSKMTVKSNVKNSTAKVSAISVGFRNSEINKLVKIQGWELQFAADFDKGEPKR
jgi:hypothetical protein